MPRKNFPNRRKQRHAEAVIRQAEYDALTEEQKIARAVSSPGNSRREFTRFADRAEGGL